jgi:hypothetical protein
MSPRHARRPSQVVAEDHAVELQPVAQDLAQPLPRESRRVRVDCRIHDVRRHHRIEPRADQRIERDEVVALDLVEAARVDRHLVMRVRGDEAVSREVLADARHPAVAHPFDQRRRELRGRVGIAMKRAVADHRAAAVIEIEHRREAEIDAVTGQLVGHDATVAPRFARAASDRRPTARPACASAESR